MPQRVLLIIDNAPCHPDENELVVGDLKTIFLPPNVTSILQPMDQQVLQQIKRQYKKKASAKNCKGRQWNFHQRKTEKGNCQGCYFLGGRSLEQYF